MPDIQATNLSPGTEDLRDRHFLVFSSATPPLGRESDQLTAAFAKFAYGQSQCLDLVIRVADPATLRADAPFWSRIRVYPDRTSVTRTGPLQCTFSGTAYMLTPEGEETGSQLVCSVTIAVEDRPAHLPIGELALSNTTGGTT